MGRSGGQRRHGHLPPGRAREYGGMKEVADGDPRQDVPTGGDGAQQNGRLEVRNPVAVERIIVFGCHLKGRFVAIIGIRRVGGRGSTVLRVASTEVASATSAAE